jgi:hypothetical protein
MTDTSIRQERIELFREIIEALEEQIPQAERFAKASLALGTSAGDALLNNLQSAKQSLLREIADEEIEIGLAESEKRREQYLEGSQ